MKIINTATYLYTACACTGKDANGRSLIKKFPFPSFQRTHKKTEISKEDYALLIQHPNFKYRVDNDLIRIEGLEVVEKPKSKPRPKPKMKDVEEVDATDVASILEE